MSWGVDDEFVLIANRCLVEERVETRNSVCYRAIGPNAVFDSTPLVSVRKTAWKTALREWEWFMSGSNKIADLHPSVHHWWKEWAKGYEWAVYNNYSDQFRRYTTGNEATVRFGWNDPDDEPAYFDQIAWVIDAIKKHPFSRRNVITTWNPYEMQLSETPITNCHGSLIQFYGHNDGRLSMEMKQRSCDVVCGLPHNWIQYWAFLMWIAHRTGRKVGRFYWSGGDVHVYDAHRPLLDKMHEAMRTHRIHSTPQLVYTPTSDEFKADDFTLSEPYSPLLTDKAEMIV